MGSGWLLLTCAVLWTINSLGVGVWLGYWVARHRQADEPADDKITPGPSDDDRWSPLAGAVAKGVSQAGAAARKAEWLSSICEETSAPPRALVAAIRDLTSAVRDLHLQVGSIFAAFELLRAPRRAGGEIPLLSGYPRGEARAEIDLIGRRRRTGHELPLPLMRFPYPCRQWVAPCIDGELPAPRRFFQVQCRDLDRDGIAFYVDSLLAAETFVISLGSRDGLTFMLARVLSEHAQLGDQPGKYLLECRFIRRVEEETYRWNAAKRAIESGASVSNQPLV